MVVSLSCVLSLPQIISPCQYIAHSTSFPCLHHIITLVLLAIHTCMHLKFCSLVAFIAHTCVCGWVWVCILILFMIGKKAHTYLQGISVIDVMLAATALHLLIDAP